MSLAAGGLPACRSLSVGPMETVVKRVIYHKYHPPYNPNKIKAVAYPAHTLMSMPFTHRHWRDKGDAAEFSEVEDLLACLGRAVAKDREA